MIDIDNARELLKRAVETRGRDFVYINLRDSIGCYYLPITDPLINHYFQMINPDDHRANTACLIGVALDLAGETRHHTQFCDVISLHFKYPDMMSSQAAAYFQVAQAKQDNGSTWGEAYDAAEEYLK